MDNLKSFTLIAFASFVLHFSNLYAADKKSATEKDAEMVAIKKPAKAVSTGDKIYTWIDNRGNRIYSDVPREGAEEMQIQKGTDFDASAIKVKKSNSIINSLKQNKNTYKKFSIVSPPNDATIRNNQGSFQVALMVSPAIFPGHSIQLTIDGKSVKSSRDSLFSLTNVDRGTHTLMASIVGKNGQSVISSQPVVIHMHRGGR